MKTASLLLASLLMVSSAFAYDVSTMLSKAQRDFARGDMNSAKTEFNKVLKEDAHNTTAINYLRMIAAADKGKKNNALKQKLEALVIPKIALKDATFNSALDFLTQQASKLSGGKIKVSFVVKLPKNFAKTQKVTLNLNDVPFTEVLTYIGALTGTQFQIQQYAILVTKKEATSPVNQPPGAQPSATPAKTPAVSPISKPVVQ